jgi:circadian clock protein KaiC
MATPDITPRTPPADSIEKAPTGIPGFDEITRGGLPCGRVSLLLGGPGTGKTVFALQALVNGARAYREPGIFVALEESSRQIVANAATFGWDIPALERERLFFLDARLSPLVVHAGAFDLSGMLAGLTEKVRNMGARRIVFDGIDVLLSLLDDPVAERREMYRLADWLREHDLTGVITGKADDRENPEASRYSFMQFMVDAVVLFQHRLTDRVSLRTLRVLKYRGTGFGENEYPLVISGNGIDVATFGETQLHHQASGERISTGVERLDTMLGGGYYRGSGVLITGVPGTAKTTLVAACSDATCRRDERALYVSFDEAVEPLVRNLKSVGIDFSRHIDDGRLEFYAVRTESRGAEEHLLDIKNRILAFSPSLLVIDPISALGKTGGMIAASHASLRLLDFAKAKGITVLCTSLVHSNEPNDESTAVQISTIADTWIHVAYLVKAGERNRTLTIVKSRGMRHSNQVREMILSNEGVTLTDVYTAGGEVLVGTARWERERQMREEEQQRQRDLERRRAQLELAEAETRARIAALERELAARRTELDVDIITQRGVASRQEEHDSTIRRLRGADAGADATSG